MERNCISGIIYSIFVQNWTNLSISSKSVNCIRISCLKYKWRNILTTQFLVVTLNQYFSRRPMVLSSSSDLTNIHILKIKLLIVIETN